MKRKLLTVEYIKEKLDNINEGYISFNRITCYEFGIQKFRNGNMRLWVNGSIAVKYDSGIIALDFLILNKKAKSFLYSFYAKMEKIRKEKR